MFIIGLGGSQHKVAAIKFKFHLSELNEKIRDWRTQNEIIIAGLLWLMIKIRGGTSLCSGSKGRA